MNQSYVPDLPPTGTRDDAKLSAVLPPTGLRKELPKQCLLSFLNNSDKFRSCVPKIIMKNENKNRSNTANKADNLRQIKFS
jgi:hypothetical protein